jgi:hypothetical protein
LSILGLIAILANPVCVRAEDARSLPNPGAWECLSGQKTCEFARPPELNAASKPVADTPAVGPPGAAKAPESGGDAAPQDEFPKILQELTRAILVLAAALLIPAAIQAFALFRLGAQLKKTVAATAAAGNVAQKSADALQGMETGYLYLRDPFDGNIRNARTSAQPLQNLATSVVFRNCGRTPVTIQRLSQAYVYAAAPEEIYSVPKKVLDLPPGIVVPAAAESQTFRCPFNFSLNELNAVSSGKGLIVYVCLVEYEDIFMRKRETSVCRVYSGGAAFVVDGDKRLNYFT